jgi:alpha-L-fucosidase 2
MSIAKFKITGGLLLFLCKCGFLWAGTPEDTLRLWYAKPASDWMTEALPIGNGYIGAMFFGDPATEHIQFSEGSLWSGGPGSKQGYNYGIRENAFQSLAAVRKLLDEQKFREADALASKELTGIRHTDDNGKSYDFGAQQTMGDLYVQTSLTGKVEHYRRELDISHALGSVSFTANGIRYSRTFMGNYPQRIMVYRFNSSAKQDYTIWFSFPHERVAESYEGGVYHFVGKVKGNGQLFETVCSIRTDGKISFRDGRLTVSSAAFITLIHTAATDYVLKYPAYKGNDFTSQNKRVLKAVASSGFGELLKKHLQDYSQLFDRVSFRLDAKQSTMPTDQRLQAYAAGSADPQLECLLFQYGRYLMISASRPGSMPLNLQGKWNNSTSPPWECDYHMNINEEMLYWPAEVTNLSECHQPLMAYIASLVEPGKKSAKAFFNAPGWVVNTMNNEWGYTSPGWGLPWGYFPGGAAWLCQHLWEHYTFTNDTLFLRHTAYPIMKEAALFWMDYLVKDENGYWVSSPSYSPEHGTISKGATMDHEIAWDVFSNCIRACEVLGADKDFQEALTAKRDQILPLRIGSWGQLQEWKEDLDDPEDHHRHVSQLFALYPGSEISLEKTPALAKAAQVSLLARGDEGTGWSLAWKICFWARLHNGDKAYQLLRLLVRPADGPGASAKQYASGLYSNLLDACPPFQLDGNMGTTAGIAEMLVQSQEDGQKDHIQLLPALPPSWNSGSVKGLCARGGFVVDIQWKDRKVVNARLFSRAGNPCTVFLNGKTVELATTAGKMYSLQNYLK